MTSEVQTKHLFAALVLCFATMLLVLAAGCGASSSTATTTPACVPSTTPEFAYSLLSGSNPEGSSVAMYTVNSCTGAFTPVAPYTIPTGISQSEIGGEQMVTDPLGRFAYVANLVSNATSQSTISMYTINSTTGVLTATSPATVPTGFFPQGIAIDPLGRFVYTANTDDSSVSMFTINQTTGVLTPTTPAAVTTMIPGQAISDPGFLTVDPAGKFLYVSAGNSNGSTVSIFSIDQTSGLLSPTTPAYVYTYGEPFQVVVAPNGKFAYVVNNLSSAGETDAVAVYTVDSSTGILTESVTPVSAGNGPTAIVVDPTSSYAYVTNRGDNTVSMYTIDPNTGNLKLNTTSNYPAGAIGTGSEPFRINFDPSGRFVYVTNEASNASIYTVNKDGTLTNTTVTGSPSLSIAFASAK
jgi:6-phosphogluconolactonase (cycloisomerase 2 family)